MSEDTNTHHASPTIIAISFAAPTITTFLLAPAAITLFDVTAKALPRDTKSATNNFAKTPTITV
jgi:hypothetical protein